MLGKAHRLDQSIERANHQCGRGSNLVLHRAVFMRFFKQKWLKKRMNTARKHENVLKMH